MLHSCKPFHDILNDMEINIPSWISFQEIEVRYLYNIIYAIEVIMRVYSELTF